MHTIKHARLLVIYYYHHNHHHHYHFSVTLSRWAQQWGGRAKMGLNWSLQPRRSFVRLQVQRAQCSLVGLLLRCLDRRPAWVRSSPRHRTAPISRQGGAKLSKTPASPGLGLATTRAPARWGGGGSPGFGSLRARTSSLETFEPNRPSIEAGPTACISASTSTYNHEYSYLTKHTLLRGPLLSSPKPASTSTRTQVPEKPCSASSKTTASRSRGITNRGILRLPMPSCEYM